MFTYFTDRDGKFQLKSLAESGFDPLARTCQFMLTEEAHHMQVGDSGIARIIDRTLSVMKKLNTDDPYLLRKNRVIDLPTIQKYINFWFSSSLDLFGSEVSSNAALAFSNGLKGRPDEFKYADHIESDTYMEIEKFGENNTIIKESIPIRNAINDITRNAYINDCNIGLKRWNRMIQKNGFSYFLTLPSVRFNRSIGNWNNKYFTPEGNILSKEDFDKNISEYLPIQIDKNYINELMVPVYEPGKTANWIASPRRGINNLAIDYPYVR